MRKSRIWLIALIGAIGDLIRELAAYERAAHEAVASDEDLAAALFGDVPVVYCHLAEVDGQVAHRRQRGLGEGWLCYS